jgi:hypothetical protein
MKRKPRIYYSDSQKALMWERWRQGPKETANSGDRDGDSVPKRFDARLDNPNRS